MHPTCAAVTVKAFIELAIHVMSVQFVLDTVDFSTFFLWLIYECPAIWSSEVSLSSFQMNHAW